MAAVLFESQVSVKTLARKRIGRIPFKRAPKLISWFRSFFVSCHSAKIGPMTSKPPKSIGRKILKLLLFLIIAVPAVLTIFLAVQGSSSRAMKSPGQIQAGGTVTNPKKPNWVSSADGKNKEHFIAPLKDASPTIQQVESAIEENGGVVVKKEGNEDNWRLYCEFQSGIFGFVDDLIVSNSGLEADIDWEKVNNIPAIHFISSSRVGYSDLGANRQRVEKLKKAIQDMMK